MAKGYPPLDNVTGSRSKPPHVVRRESKKRMSRVTHPLLVLEIYSSEEGLKIKKMALIKMPNTAAVAMAGKPLGKPGKITGIKPPG